jgi:hypothetical protein
MAARTGEKERGEERQRTERKAYCRRGAERDHLWDKISQCTAHKERKGRKEGGRGEEKGISKARGEKKERSRRTHHRKAPGQRQRWERSLHELRLQSREGKGQRFVLAEKPDPLFLPQQK